MIEIKGKEVNEYTLEIDGVDSTDYPDFCDAYFTFGKYVDDQKLTEEDLMYLTENYQDVLSAMAFDTCAIKDTDYLYE